MNIAKMAVKLSADAAGLASGLTRAGGTMLSWAAKTASAITSAFGSVGSALAAPLAGAASAYSSFKGMADDLVSQDREARRLGVTMDEMRQATVWAGDAAGSLSGILEQAQGKLAAFHTGSVTAAQDLASLAKAAGGTGAGIGGGGFAGIVQALERIPDPVHRAAQAFKLLGGGASDVLDRIGKPGGFAASQDQAKRFGLGVGAGDMQMVRAASDAMRTLEMMRQGFWNQVLLGLAPVVSAVAALFKDTKANLEWIQPAMLGVAKAAAMTGAFLYEAFSDGDLWKKTIGAVGTALVSMVGMVGDALSNLSIDVMNSLLHEDNFLDVPSLFGDALGVGKKAREEREAERKAIRGIDLSGFGDVAKAFADTAAFKGVNEFFNNIDTRLKDTKDNLTGLLPAIRLLGDQFKQMQESTLGPGQRFAEQMAGLRAMSAVGLLRGNDTGALGAFKAFDALRGSAGQYQPAGAALSGSREAYSALAQNEAMARRGDVQQQIKQLLENAQRQRDEQIRIGREMIREFHDKEPLAVLEG